MDESPRAEVRQVGRWRHSITVHHGITQWGPNGGGWYVWGRARAERKARRKLQAYLAAQRRTGPCLVVTDPKGAAMTDQAQCGLPGSTEPMYGLGDLALFLGGSQDSFTGRLLELIAKAQATPENLAGLRAGFPRQVRAWELWMATSPAPSADQLRALLDGEG